MSQIFIAEIKIKSPFGYASPYSFDKLMNVAIEHGDWISVHDNALWGGDYETISFVRNNTKKLILAKGMHYTLDSIQKAFDAGADFVLTVNANLHTSPGFDNRIIYEPNIYHGFQDGFERCCRISVNHRNLKTGEFYPIEETKAKIQSALDNNHWVCQSSGIKTKSDILSNVHAYIVGTHLMEFVKTL